MPTIISRGAFSGKAFGLTSQTTTPVYVEDVFSTYLYTGNGSTQTITNNIDLSTKGGMVWIKERDQANSNIVEDTLRGTGNDLITNSTAAQSTGNTSVTAFNTNGFSLGNAATVNYNTGTFVGWTFRKQPKFFDVVTYTGTGSPTTIAHNLGVTPGMIIVKSTDGPYDWGVYHKSLGATKYINLNTTSAAGTSTTYWNDTAPTATNFTVGNSGSTGAGSTNYVAYLFADQAGGFGLSGSDSVVACGSFTTDGSSNATVNLGWEPQFAIIKKSSGVANWLTLDNMRGMPASPATSAAVLKPNATDAEINNGSQGYINPTATGFTATIAASSTYIYLAIRRGPMKVPTSGTSVFSPNAYTGNGSTGQTITSGFPVDMYINCDRTNSANMSSYTFPLFTRLLSVDNALETASTDAWGGGWGSNYWRIDNNIGTVIPAGTGGAASFNNQSGVTFVNYNFLRAPGFFDIVCYTGTGVARTVAHNLGVAPELIIVKSRNRTGIYVTGWGVYSAATGVSNALSLNETTPSQAVGTAFWNSTTPTSSVFSLGTNDSVNAASNGNSYIAYLFATCPGVSKVGSYTGTGAAQNINCGFSAGARFVLLKRTDSTGDWFVYDSARGISSGNDPYLLLNSTAAEVTGTNYVDTFASGFTLTATAPAALNANGGSYIFLAIA